MTTIHDQRFVKLVEQLRLAREAAQITQSELGARLGMQQSDISKVEQGQRRLDIIELLDWLAALGIDNRQFLHQVGILDPEKTEAKEPLPERGNVKPHPQGVLQQLAWQGQLKEVLLENITVEEYLDIERQVSAVFAQLNLTKNVKNRDAICQALEYAIHNVPRANPSDIYHHIVYRLYLREYSRSDAGQSWVRAGGEGVELFVERNYKSILAQEGITIRTLIARSDGPKALQEMGIYGTVGDSKLDIALYGLHKGKQHIFGGIHCKASLAERVTDDVPCSEAMMRNNFASFLFTFDAKSFPPPHGDLVNRGELGSRDSPSDKRKYIEEHGSFSACFSYNLRTNPSPEKTNSGKRIFVSTFEQHKDPFPREIIAAWKEFRKSL